MDLSLSIWFSASYSASTEPESWRRPRQIPCDNFEGGAPTLWRAEVGMNAFLQRLVFPIWAYWLASSFPLPPSLVFIIVSGITNQVDDGVSRKLEFRCMESQRHVKNERSLEKIKQQQKLVKEEVRHGEYRFCCRNLMRGGHSTGVTWKSLWTWELGIED